MKSLTPKMTAFCEEYVRNGYNASLAYEVAYGQENKNISKVEAYKMLKDGKIINHIKEIETDFVLAGHEHGLSRYTIMKVLADMILNAKKTLASGIQVPDYIAINNAINTYAKLTGEFAAEKKTIELTEKSEVNIDDLKTDEDIQNAKDAILKDM